MSKWSLKFDLKFDKNENIFDSSVEKNFTINEGINFIIGKNNSGKTKLIDLIANKKIKVTDENKKIYIDNIIYFSDKSINIENENIEKDRIFGKYSLGLFTKEKEINPDKWDPTDYEENLTWDFVSSIKSVFLKEFLSNKTLERDDKNPEKINFFIDGISSDLSGMGENRISYILYTFFLINKRIDSIEKSVFSIKMLKEKIDFFLNEEEEETKNSYNYVLENLESYDPNDIPPADYFNDPFFEHRYSEFIWDEKKLRLFFQFIKKIGVENNNLGNYIFHLFLKNNLIEECIMEECINNGIIDGETWDIQILIEEILLNDENNSENIFNKDFSKSFLWYLKEYENNNLDFLLIIDEPENYLHKSKYKLLKEMFEEILKLNKSGMNIRILVTTHEEELLKLNNSYLHNVNLAYKEKNKLFLKNIFNNDIGKFIDSLKETYKENFDMKEFSKEIPLIKNNDQKDIQKDIDDDDDDNKKFLQWFLTFKNNLSIFFSIDNIIVEGSCDKIILEGLYPKKNIIETDGTHLGTLIFLVRIYFYLI